MDKFDMKSTIKINIFMLKLTGLWPEKSYKFDAYTIFAIIVFGIFVFLHNIFQSISLFFLGDNLQKFTANLYVVVTDWITLLKLYYFVKNMTILKELMVVLGKESFQPTNSHQVRLVDESRGFWTKMYRIFGVSVILAMVLFGFLPILDKSTKRRLPFYAWYPYNEQASPWYELTYVYQMICVSVVASTELNIDMMFGAMMMYVGLECDILCDNLRNLRRCTMDEIGLDCHKEVFEKKVNENVVKCIKHHEEIVTFAVKSNKFFNGHILGQFAASISGICVPLFELSTIEPMSNEFYTPIGGLLAYLLETFIYCWFGNYVLFKSANIGYAAFQSEWYTFPLEARKNLLILMVRTQRFIRISAFNLFDASLETYMSILRLSWSVFAVLRSRVIVDEEAL